MATYYRWRESEIGTGTETTSNIGNSLRINGSVIYLGYSYSLSRVNFKINSYQAIDCKNDTSYTPISYQKMYISSADPDPTVIYELTQSTNTNSWGRQYLSSQGQVYIASKNVNVPIIKHTFQTAPGEFRKYVYSTSSSAYPNGGVQGGYYYDQRTTVTSPTAPTGLTYPNPITTPSAAISWTAATSNTDSAVSLYEVSYSINGGSSWTTAGTTENTNYSVPVPTSATSIQFRVRAKDSNGQWGSYVTGTASQIILAPDLTVPQMVMQGQSATVSWSAIEGADSYTLQRKSSADSDWTQVYSGANLSYTETVGTWTSLQYRVQAVFDGTAGGWATSAPIQIASASALVISSQDGDLGTLVNDVPYSISSDQTSPTIDVTVEVNGGEYASFQAVSGQTYHVDVLDLPTGTGSIVITATTEVSSSPVSVTRTWTYSKTDISFPDNGSVAGLTQEGATIWPKTLDEAVRTALNPWGGNLSTALNLLKNAALFNRTSQPKYSEVTISMANVTEGQIVNIPRGGVMVPHYVAKLEYESGLNGPGRRLLVPVECYDKRAWDAGNVNAYATSDIDAWMNSTYKALFPSEIQTAMGTTKFYYTPGNGNDEKNTLERAVFSLSMQELGNYSPAFNQEGSTLPNYESLRPAFLNGVSTPYWTRSPYKGGTNRACFENSSSTYTDECKTKQGSRPCFTLPDGFTAGPYLVGQNGTIHESQEYTEAGDWLDVLGNAIPAVKIEAGSYVGTGTSGQSNPNELTLPFEPKMVVVTATGATGLGASTGMLWNGNPTIGSKSVTLDGNALSWYDSSAANQLNTSGTTYYYVAIG